MADQYVNGYAILIGVNDCLNPTWALPDVEKDVQELQKVFVHPQRCAYPHDNVKVLLNEESSRENILNGLDWLEQKINEDISGNVTAVIFYSGHGFRDDTIQPSSYYLIPYDVKTENFRSRALRAEDFASAISDLRPTRLLVILDCCHAGGMDVKNLTDYIPASVPSQIFIPPIKAVSQNDCGKGLELLNRGAGRAVLSSSQGTQQSYIRKDRAMSIFTYHLIEALTGHAQPEEGATEVLVSDVMSYVWRKVPESAKTEYGKQQEPHYLADGNFPIAMLLGGKGIAKGQHAPDALSLHSSDLSTSEKIINTGGGAYIGGNVKVGGDFAGRDMTKMGDQIHGDKISGDKITVGDISGQAAVGRNSRVSVTSGISVQELQQLFDPLITFIQKSSAPDQAEALSQVEDLQQEVAKGEEADDSKVGGLIDDVISLVPDAVSYIAKIFGTPYLDSIAGPITKFVLNKFMRKKKG